jgi:anti-sigma B factor antagonist
VVLHECECFDLFGERGILVKIDKRQEDRAIVITVGEPRLTADLAPTFKAFVLEALSPKAGALLILDLSAVSVMDSSGLGALVSVLKGLGGKGDLRVVGLSRGVRELFRLTRMDRVFRIYENVDSALLGDDAG